MSKKVIPVDEGDGESSQAEKSKIKPKKKRSKCCTCCLVFLIVLLVILAAAFGVGWYFGDMFTKSELDMSLADTLGVVSDLYWAKDKKVVTNPYSDADLDGFYTQIKKNILLKEDAEVDFSAALEKALGGITGGNANASRKNIKDDPEGDDYYDDDNGNGEGESGSGDTSIMNAFVDMIAEVFTRENIDIERLKEYSPENDTYMFELHDKQLAAFINSVLRLLLESGSIEGLEELSKMVDLSKAVALKQIRFKAVSSQNEVGESVMTATTADITVWLGLQSTAGQALSYFATDNGYGWAAGPARFLCNVLLPKNIYATLTVPLQGEADAQITLNSMNERKRDRAYKLVNGIMALTGSGDQTVQSLLGGIAEKITPVVEKAAGSIDFRPSAHGEIDLDLIGAMAELASKDMADPLQKSDFMYMLQAVLTSDADARLVQLRPYLYDKWYVDGDNKYEYDPADKSGKTQVNYEREFVKQIEDKYMVDFGEDATLSDVLKMLGVNVGGSSGDGASGGVGVDDIIGQLNAQKFHASFDKPTSELRLRITDRMLAAALSGQMDSLMGSDSSFSDLEIDLDALTFVKRKGSNHTFALVAVQVNVSAMLGGVGGSGEMLGKLAANVLPDKILLSIYVDITQSLGAGESYEETSFMFNDYENTDRIISTLSKLIPDLDLASVSDGLGQTLRDMIHGLDEKMNIELVASTGTGDDTTNGALVLPDIFTVITKTILVDDDGAPLVSAEDLKTVLRALDNTDGVEGKDGEIADDYSGFIADVVDTYYLRLEPTEETTFNDLVDFIADGEGEAFGAEKFRVKDEAPNSLVYDKRMASELCPVMSTAELGALIKSNMGTNESVKDFTLTDVRITARENSDALDLVIVMSASITKLLPGDMSKLLTSEEIYVTVTVEDVNNPVDGSYPVKLRINNMDEGTYNTMMTIARHFGADFDISAQTAEFGKILYDQIHSLESSVGEGFVTFTEDGLRLKSFYSFLASKLDLFDTDENGNKVEVDPEYVKEALQGMYPHNANAEPNNPYNFVLGDIVQLPGATEYDGGNVAGFSKYDKQFNGFFEQAMDLGGMDGVHALQTIALAANGAGESDSEKAAAIREWANKKIAGAPITPDKDFVLVTFSLEISKSEDGDDNDATDEFLPEYIYATVALEKTRVNGKDRFEDCGQIFNNMGAEARKILLKMMNLSEDSSDDGKINIHSVIMTCLQALNGGDGKAGIVDAYDITLSKSDDISNGVGILNFKNKYTQSQAL